MARSSIATRFPAAILALAVFFAAPAMSDPPEPARIIETFHDTLLRVMKNAKALGYDGRYRTLAPAIGKTFHLRSMSRMVAGRRNWKGFSEAERASFVSAFSELVTATYAHRFDGYSGQSFRILDTAPLRPGTVFVKTRVDRAQPARPGRKDTKLNYVLRRFDGGWRAIDVYLRGSISEVATKRSEYSGILRKQGVSALIERIRKKAASLASEATRRTAPLSPDHDA